MTSEFVYCDSNVFLGYFNDEPGRAPLLEQLFERVAQHPTRRLLTAVITVTEVAQIGRERVQGSASSLLDPTTEALLDAFWENEALIQVVEVDGIIARQARRLVRTASALKPSRRLKTLDAIHLATAQLAGAAHFFTYDEPLYPYTRLTNLNIGAPFLLDDSL